VHYRHPLSHRLVGIWASVLKLGFESGNFKAKNFEFALQNIMAAHSIPKTWRKAKVIAMENPGKDQKIAANYHPISLLSTCYKLLEHLALQRISPAVEELLSPDQAGFQKTGSTCDQVTALTIYIENGFQQQLKTGAVFLNMTAACDTVWHTGLLYRLSKYLPG